MITTQAWRDWTRDPVTKLFIDGLLKNRLDRLNDIGEGAVEGDELYREIGRTQGIMDSVEFALNRMKELTTLDEEDEQNGGKEATFG